jgi:hypothetical protein
MVEQGAASGRSYTCGGGRDLDSEKGKWERLGPIERMSRRERAGGNEGERGGGRDWSLRMGGK